MNSSEATCRRRVRSWLSGWLLLAALVPAALVLGLAMMASGGYRRPPSPAGMVVRVEVRQVHSLFDRITVEPSPSGYPAFIVNLRGTSNSPASSIEYAYPSGERTRVVAQQPSERAIVFDFNGDGAVDRVQIGDPKDRGLVRVVSGGDGSVLFEDRDDLRYVNPDRAFPLGDLDGDGYGELALVYPREDRSEYDFVVQDMIFTPRSWVVIVSGSRMKR